MSKRSGLSRFQDLKRGFVDIGRYRYILHKFDMETWRDKTCPICGEGFTKEPNYYFMSFAIHTTLSGGKECGIGPEWETWVAKITDETYGPEEDYHG